MFAELVREEVPKYMSFKQLASAANVASSTLSQYINEKRSMPRDVEASIIEATKSPRLSEERCFNCEGNMFPTRYLDNIDGHPIVALDKMIEEAAEFIRAAAQARKALINKKRGYVFEGKVNEVVTKLEDDCADLITGSKTVLIKLQEYYQRPVIQTMQRHIAKLEKYEYCTKRKRPGKSTGLKKNS